MPPSETIRARYRDKYGAKVLHGGELTGAASELDVGARAWEPADHRNHHFTGLRVARTQK